MFDSLKVFESEVKWKLYVLHVDRHLHPLSVLLA